MRLPEQQPRREIENLLPLVNVVFLLLIFFMVAGAFTSPNPFSIKPTISDNELLADTKTLTILMNEQGKLAVDDQIVTTDVLIHRINQYLNNGHSLKKVQLKPDANASAVDVIELLNRMSQTELTTLHLLTTSAQP